SIFRQKYRPRSNAATSTNNKYDRLCVAGCFHQLSRVIWPGFLCSRTTYERDRHPQGPWRVGGESVADVIERLHCARDHLRRHIHAAGILRPGSLARRVRVSYKYFLDDLFDYRSGGVGHHVVHGEFSSHQGSVGKSGEVVEVGVILPFLLTWSHDLAT